MEWIIWLGAALTVIGVLMLVYCIVIAVKTRKSALPEEEMKAKLQKVVTLNLGALAISAIGLMAVIFGIVLA